MFTMILNLPKFSQVINYKKSRCDIIPIVRLSRLVDNKEFEKE